MVLARQRAVWVGVDATLVELEAGVGVCPDGNSQRAISPEGLRVLAAGGVIVCVESDICTLMTHTVPSNLEEGLGRGEVQIHCAARVCAPHL